MTERSNSEIPEIPESQKLGDVQVDLHYLIEHALSQAENAGGASVRRLSGHDVKLLARLALAHLRTCELLELDLDD